MTTRMDNRSQAILGIGNALVDMMISLEDDVLLKQFGLPKGSMTLVDAGLSARIQQATEGLKRQMQTGGSAANTVHGIARLGGDCGYLGKISRDSNGDFFRSEFERHRIRTHMLYSNTGTGLATALISPDSERTFGTYLGAASEMEASELCPELFEGYGLVHVEGYLVQNHGLIEAILRTAKTKGLTVSMDMASYNMVEANLEFLKHLIREYVDIVFANEDEAKALTGLEPGNALARIAEWCRIAVVKIGAQGSWIQRGDEVVKIDAIPARSVDTTGAGDIYAAGVLFSLAQGYSLELAGQIGSLLSGKVVEVIGAKLPEEHWESLLSEIAVLGASR